MNHLYQLEPIKLTTGIYYANHILPQGATQETILVNFTPDLLHVFIATADIVDDIEWDLTPELVGNSILDIPELEESFDDEAGKFKYDDLKFTAHNLDKFWTQKVVNSLTKAEIRIVLERAGGEKKPVFWGIIDYPSTEYNPFVGIEKGDMYAQYRTYDLCSISYNNLLKEKTIDDLKNALIYSDQYDKLRVLDTCYNKENGGNIVDLPVGAVGSKTRYGIRLTPLKDIFKIAIGLIDPLHSKCNIKSDFKFKSGALDNVFSLDSNLPDEDNIYIITEGYYSAAQVVTGAPNYTFFDPDTSKTGYSFYTYGNCVKLVAELSNIFGMVWQFKYDIADVNKFWLFDFTYDISSRYSGIEIDEDLDILSVQGSIQGENNTGAVVTVVDRGDVTAGIESEGMLKLTCPFQVTTGLEYTKVGKDWFPTSFGDYANANLFAVKGGRVYLINQVLNTMTGKFYPQSASGLTVENCKDNIYKTNFGQAIADYFGDSTGVYTQYREALKVKVNGISARYNGVDSTDYLKPNNFMWITYGSVRKRYNIISVKKNLITQVTELELRYYE